MERVKDVNSVSRFFFFLLSFCYMVMVLSLRNGFMTDLSLLLMRILDLPFALIALLYGGTAIALELAFDQEGRARFGWALGIFVICLGIFTAIAIINFAFPAVI